MYVRLAFAVAAHLEPEILLVDEVLAVGDAAFQKKCLGKMGEVAREGRTVLFVSHNMASILALCQRVILLNAGTLLGEGSTQEVVREYLKSTISQDIVVLDERADREGDGSARMISCQIESVESGHFISSSSRLKFTLAYKSDRPLKHVRFLVTIYDYTNTGIYLFDSDAVGGIPETLPAEGVVSCTTEPINLTPGRCYINLALFRGTAIADHIEQAASFDVEADEFYSTGRVPPRDWVMCLLKHKWSFNEHRIVKKIIPSNEITFHPLSFQDEAGRLFQWRGGLYRGISAGSAPVPRSVDSRRCRARSRRRRFAHRNGGHAAGAGRFRHCSKASIAPVCIVSVRMVCRDVQSRRSDHH